jgi:DNA-directed RNA polymerase subunit F|tara:strand:- start:1339 stop:1638 length:300 start_codon:yes stop_codon:yes gene_type:complete
MILEKTPIPSAQIKDHVKDLDEKPLLKEYLKKFIKIDSKKSKELFEEIKALDNIKIKDEHIVKICDLLPTDAEEVNKIFIDVSLSEEETNAILEIVKKY